MFWKRNELKTCLDKLMGKKKSDEGENEEQQQGSEGGGNTEARTVKGLVAGFHMKGLNKGE